MNVVQEGVNRGLNVLSSTVLRMIKKAALWHGVFLCEVQMRTNIYLYLFIRIDIYIYSHKYAYA